VTDRRGQVAAALAAAVVGIAVTLATLLAVAAQPGGVVGLTRDGVSYLGAASNLAGGRGLTGAFTTGVDLFSPDEAVAFDGRVPFVQWPPLLPAVLAVPESLGSGEPGTDGRHWAGLLNALALGAVAALTTVATCRLAAGGAAGVVAGVLAGLLVAVPADVAVVQLTVSSEPLFTLFVLAAALASVRRLRGGSTAWLVAACALGGAAALTRFVGVAVLAALTLVLWWDGRRRATGWHRHEALVAGALAVLPAAAWMVWTSAAAGGRSRPVAWHPPGRDQWASMGTTVWSWVAASGGSTAVRTLMAVAAVLALTAAAWGWRRAWRDSAAPVASADGPPDGAPDSAPDGAPDSAPDGAPDGADAGRAWWSVVVVVVPVYLLAVVATHALLDRVVPIGGRMLSPLLPLVVPLVAAGVVRALRSVAPGPASRIAAATAIGLASLAVISASTAWRDLATRPWQPAPAEQASPTGAWLRQLGPETVVVANDPAFAWMSSPRRHVIDAPTREWVTAGQPNRQFDDHLEQLGALMAGDAVVVLYDLPAALSPNYVTLDELTNRLGLVVVADTGDGIVLANPGWARTPDPTQP
jgi:hypothetical protein